MLFCFLGEISVANDIGTRAHLSTYPADQAFDGSRGLAESSAMGSERVRRHPQLVDFLKVQVMGSGIGCKH